MLYLPSDARVYFVQRDTCNVKLPGVDHHIKRDVVICDPTLSIN